MLYKIVKVADTYGINLNDIFIPFNDQSYNFRTIELINSSDVLIKPIDLYYGMPVRIFDKVDIWSKEMEESCKDSGYKPTPIYYTALITSRKYKKISNVAYAGKAIHAISSSFLYIEIISSFVFIILAPLFTHGIIVNFISSCICCLIYIMMRLGDYDDVAVGAYRNYRIYMSILSFILFCKFIEPVSIVWIILTSLYGYMKIYSNYRCYKEEYILLYRRKISKKLWN